MATNHNNFINQGWVKWATVGLIAYAIFAGGKHPLSSPDKEKAQTNKPATAGTTAPEEAAPEQESSFLNDKLQQIVTPVIEQQLGKELQAKKIASATLMVLDTLKGTGETIACGQEATIHYSAALPDGKEFINTYKKNQPLTFTLGNGQVIKGLEQGIIGMKKGGKRSLTIPPSLAYDDPAFTNNLAPAYSTITMDVELLNVNGTASGPEQCAH